MHSVDDVAEPELPLSGNWCRLIPSRFPTIELYERVATLEQSQVVKEIEMLTNPRKQQRDALARSSQPASSDGPHKYQNWNHAPFAYPNPLGSRYLGPHYNALELFETLEGAMAAAIRKREAFLSATRQPRLSVVMRVIRHEFRGFFVDRRTDPADMSTDQRRLVGARLHKAGKHGVYYPCPELPHTRAVSLFHGEGLGHATQAEHFRFLWDGTAIAGIYPCTLDSDDDVTPILPRDIFSKATP